MAGNSAGRGVIMAKPKKIEKKPALKNAGKVSMVPETEPIKTKVASKKTAPKKTAPVVKPTVEKVVAPSKAIAGKKPVVKAKGEKGEKKAFKAEPHQALPALKKRNFMLLNAAHEDIGKFTGKSPRQAALKVANSGVVDITLRETGQRRVRSTIDGKVAEYKVHYYTGSRILRPKTEKDPDWMPAMVNIPHVEKIGSEWIPVAT
jgi:hypothetical protein